MKVEKYRKKLVGAIEKVVPGANIYLFGSWARGSARPTSDIDMAFDSGKKINRTLMRQIRESIDDLNIPHNVDIIDVCAVSKDMKDQIYQDGIVWQKK